VGVVGVDLDGDLHVNVNVNLHVNVHVGVKAYVNGNSTGLTAWRGRAA